MSSPVAPALACVPSAIPAAERQGHFALGRELLDIKAKERLALTNGYAIRFDPEEFDAVARFVANERKCCPFLAFELTLSPESGPLWLRMTGPEGSRAVLDAELNLTPTAAPAQGCACGKTGADNNRGVKWAAAGGVLAAVGVCAACCLLPFVLLSVGVAGAWVSGLDALSAYKWPLIAVAVLLLAYGFHAAYIKPKRLCETGTCRPNRTARVGLWIAVILTLGGILFQYVEPSLRSR